MKLYEVICTVLQEEVTGVWIVRLFIVEEQKQNMNRITTTKFTFKIICQMRYPISNI